MAYLFESDKTLTPLQMVSLKNNYLEIIKNYLSNDDCIRALGYIKKTKKTFSNDTTILGIEKRTYIHFFKLSYFGTSVAQRNANDKKLVSSFEWNGYASICNPGNVSNTIHQKVEERINYFRILAGAPAIYLDSQLNDWCQRAALMMESANKLTHEATNVWPCFTPEGSHAAQFSLLTKNANTTLAVTSFMADNANASLGNRRWMLYPFSLIWGHGSTKNYCAIWALDDSRTKDTNYYKKNFICWPPENYCHKMLIFNKWSFSMYQKLNDAKVNVKINGVEVPCKIEKSTEGYGLETIVFSPNIDIKTIKENDGIEIAVTLKNGTIYKYKTKVFDFN